MELRWNTSSRVRLFTRADRARASPMERIGVTDSLAARLIHGNLFFTPTSLVVYARILQTARN